MDIPNYSNQEIAQESRISRNKQVTSCVLLIDSYFPSIPSHWIRFSSWKENKRLGPAISLHRGKWSPQKSCGLRKPHSQAAAGWVLLWCLGTQFASSHIHWFCCMLLRVPNTHLSLYLRLWTPHCLFQTFVASSRDFLLLCLANAAVSTFLLLCPPAGFPWQNGKKEILVTLSPTGRTYPLNFLKLKKKTDLAYVWLGLVLQSAIAPLASAGTTVRGGGSHFSTQSCSNKDALVWASLAAQW